MAILSYAQLYQQALQQKFNKELCFVGLYSGLLTQTNTYKWVGAKTIHIPRIDVTGFVDTNRDTVGTYTRNVENSYEAKEVGHDRSFETLIDPMDVDETNMAVSIANISRVFNEEQKIPEMDKFMAQALYTQKVDFDLIGSIDNTVITAANILQVFDALCEKADEAEVPMEGRLLYITPAINTLLKQATQIERRQDVTTNGGATNRLITRLEETTIKVIPSVRMKSSYDFTTGAVPGVGAKQINMILVHPRVIIAPQKYDLIDMAAPSALTKGKYFYYERKYWDVFVLEGKSGGLQINAEA